jgi:hypothetical protein
MTSMSTTAPQLIRVERVDDLPVIWASLQRLGTAELLDRHFLTHHLWLGDQSFGEVACVWLVFVLSQGDHRLSRLQPWAEQNHLTLQALLGKTIRPLDFHDDRLADMLGKARRKARRSTQALGRKARRSTQALVMATVAEKTAGRRGR